MSILAIEANVATVNRAMIMTNNTIDIYYHHGCGPIVPIEHCRFSQGRKKRYLGLSEGDSKAIC